jgi:hypothetical protein
LPSLVKGSAALCTCKKECNKCDLTAAAQCFRFAHHNDWSRWFVISSPSPICCPTFSFIGGIAKENITKLGCQKYFHRGHILSTAGDAHGYIHVRWWAVLSYWDSRLVHCHEISLLLKMMIFNFSKRFAWLLNVLNEFYNV